MVLMLPLLMGCLGPHSVGAQAEFCGDCHGDQQAALADSAHGPHRTPLFSNLRLDAPPGACDSCHAPEPGIHPGLDCTTCHAAEGNAGEGSGHMLLGWAGPVWGPTGQPGGPHATDKGPFLESVDLCATCHTVVAPAGFAEGTPKEWRESPAGRSGQACLDCHFQDHKLVGLQADGASLLRENLTVVANIVGITLRNENAGHNLPTGAAWSRALRLRFDTGETFDLGPRLSHQGQELVDPLQATKVENQALAALESRLWSWPAGARSACVEWWAVQPELASERGLESPTPETIACENRP
jgi:hypothetical protein